MRHSRAARALAAVTLACLLAAAPALAAPDRDRPAERPTDRPAWTETVHDVVSSLWQRMIFIFSGGDPGKDRTPGSGLDPDGHKPKSQ